MSIIDREITDNAIYHVAHQENRVLIAYANNEGPDQSVSVWYAIAPHKWGINVIFFLFIHENVGCQYSLEAP